MPNSLEVAYILKGYPRLSETFIAHEIHQLENMGLRLRLFSIVREEPARVHEVVTRIRAPLKCLPSTTSLSATSLPMWLARNFGKFATDHFCLARRHPLRYLRTLCATIRMSWKYRTHARLTPRKVFIKEFLQAGTIAKQILWEGGVGHLHGHFCHGATTVTWYVSMLTGLPFSFTAHAKDIYERDLNPGDLLARKIKAARFVATCTHANQQHLDAVAPAEQNVHTIYHGLDTRYFSPTHTLAQNERDGSPLILAVGRLIEKKGFGYLVKACHHLRQRGYAFRCAIVGEPGDQSAHLRELIQALDLEQEVQILGPRTQAELRGLYAEAAVFVLPCLITDSGDRDGIPNVLAEAMAMGVPIVTTPISGIPELIRDEIEGLFVPSRDDEALSKAIARLLDSDSLRHRLSGQARARICETFDSTKTTRRLRDLFLAQLSLRQGSHGTP